MAVQERALRRNKKVYDAIVEFETQYLYPPSVKELLELTGIKGRASILMALKDLEEDGYIIVDDGKRRISLVGYKLVKVK